jgi:hypothetical protein
MSPLVVIDDFYLVGAAVAPDETDSPLLVNSNAVLAVTISFELLQTVPGETHQIVQLLGRIQHLQLLQGSPLDLGRKSSRSFFAEYSSRFPTAESLDHAASVADGICSSTENITK